MKNFKKFHEFLCNIRVNEIKIDSNVDNTKILIDAGDLSFSFNVNVATLLHYIEYHGLMMGLILNSIYREFFNIFEGGYSYYEHSKIEFNHPQNKYPDIYQAMKIMNTPFDLPEQIIYSIDKEKLHDIVKNKMLAYMTSKFDKIIEKNESISRQLSEGKR